MIASVCIQRWFSWIVDMMLWLGHSVRDELVFKRYYVKHIENISIYIYLYTGNDPFCHTNVITTGRKTYWKHIIWYTTWDTWPTRLSCSLAWPWSAGSDKGQTQRERERENISYYQIYLRQLLDLVIEEDPTLGLVVVNSPRMRDRRRWEWPNHIHVQ